jgi:hypothetical protein
MEGVDQAASGVPPVLDPQRQEEFIRQRLAALPQVPRSGVPPVSAAPPAAPAAPAVAAQPNQQQTVGSLPPVGATALPAAQQAPQQPKPPSPEDVRLKGAEDRLAQAEKPAGVEKLMTKAQNIGKSPKLDAQGKPMVDAQGKPVMEDSGNWFTRHIARPLGEVGAGALRGLNIAGDVLVPGVTAAIPGTDLNRKVQMLGARANLDDAEKSKLQAAQAEEAEAKATGAQSQQKQIADMAAKGYSQVTDAMGRTSWQFTGKGEQKNIIDDRQTIADPNDPLKQVPNPNFQKTVLGNVDPSGKVLSYGPQVGEPQKQTQQIGTQGVTSYTNQVNDLPNLSAAQKKNYAPNANDSPEQAEKKLADARDLDARIAQGKERGLKEKEQSTMKLQGEKDKAVKNTEDVLKKDQAKIEDANAALDLIRKPNGMKDALVVVKGLVVTAGGQGSGVRITKAELERIQTSRGWTGSVDVLLNNAFDPANYESLSAEQRTQLGGIVQDVLSRVSKRTDLIYAERAAIRNANSVEEINKIENQFDAQMKAMGKGKDYTRSQIEGFAQREKRPVAQVEADLKKQGWVEIPED